MKNISASLLVLSFVAGCSDPEPMLPDAAPLVTTVPRDPSGGFVLATALDLAPPPAAALVVDALDRAAADPSRFILERMLATLPDGPTKAVAQLALPFVAAYLDGKLSEIAPRFIPGVTALATGFGRIASHVELLETWTIDADGAAVRRIAGARFDVGAAPVLAFAAHGLPDVSALPRVTIDGAGKLGITEHAFSVRYGALVRAGLDLAVVPTAEPTAHDVGTALARLVDCTRLGDLVADKVGLGSPQLYRTGCIAAMAAVAAELDEHVVAIDAAPLTLELTGVALGVDVDHDGSMDAIKTGRWSGKASHAGNAQAVVATFAGTEPP